MYRVWHPAESKADIYAPGKMWFRIRININDGGKYMKKIFKRLVAAGLGVTIVAGSLAGCSSGTDTTETQAASQAETAATENAS